jgi:hypothetical protein
VAYTSCCCKKGGERATIAPHGLHIIVEAIVPDGWHTTVAALVEFSGIFLPPSFNGDVKQDYWSLVPLLAEHGRCPPWYDNNDVNRHHHHLGYR